MNNHPPPPSPGDTVVTMVPCSECGHHVPEHNMAIHQAHACGGRARRSSSSGEENNTEEPSAATGIRQRRTTAPPPETLSPRDNNNNNNNSNNNNNRANQKTGDEQVIDLLEDDDDEDEVQVVEQPSNEWPCTRCTLLNNNAETTCSACQYSKNPRTADPTRREQLIPDNNTTQQQGPPSPGAFVGGGALLGGVLGAAGAAMRGDSWVGGAVEGAMSGAMGGAVLGSTTHQMAQQQQQALQRQQEALRQAQSMHAATRQQPRASFRVNRSNSGHHTTTTIYSPDGRVQRRVVAGGPGGVDPLLGFMMANAMQQQQGGMNIDGMSYEQLLATFGDGSENRGADPRVISSLPVSRVSEDVAPEKADCDYATCSICLEVFKKGDTRKTLPCLHGFHDKCVDKWLRGNGSCPICKHVVSS